MGSSNDSSAKKATVSDETTPLLAASEPTATAEANEEQPLLDPSAHHQNGNATENEEENKPLPFTQILLLCYARLVEPIAFFCIFPFINKMIWETGNLDEADVGFYSGVIESLFSLTQMVLMIAWGKAADRIGRKPVLVISMIGMSIFESLFGFSKTIWQMIVLRCAAGVFAGTVVTIRTMIAENSTAHTQARAFSLFAFFSNLGIFLGPLIGGALADPAGQYPSLFGNVKFFKVFPYSLPTLFTGIVGFSSVLLSIAFINETLKRKKDGEASDPSESMSTWELMKAPGVGAVLYIYCHVMVLAFGYTAVLPVFMFTDSKLGGFGLSPFQISLFMGGGGLSQALWTLIAFPWLHRRIGTGGILRGCTIAWPFFFAICPLSVMFLRKGWDTAFWVVAPLNLAIGSGVAMAFTAVQLALNDIAPTYAHLGTLNAIALTLVSGIRAVAPALFSSIFAIGVKHQIAAGFLVWIVLILLALTQIVVLRWLPAKAEGLLPGKKTGAAGATDGDEDEAERERVIAAEARAAEEDVL